MSEKMLAVILILGSGGVPMMLDWTWEGLRSESFNGWWGSDGGMKEVRGGMMIWIRERRRFFLGGKVEAEREEKR